MSGSLAVKDLAFGYVAGRPILSGLTHEFSLGSVTSITGRSGRGKSTLLYLLGLLLSPASGTVTWADRAVSEMDDVHRSRLRAREFGFLFQDAQLDPRMTILDNIVEGCFFRRTSRREEDQRARQLLEQFGINIDLGRKPLELSGGQAQRVALVRALVGRPSLVLADEPTGNLDSTSCELITRGLRLAAQQGVTVVVATHDARVVGASDEVLALDDLTFA